MGDLLSVETVALTILDYPMSYIELVGTVLYLWSVWLIARKNMLTWPVGIVSVLLYMILFYQIQLYADTIEQLYYLGASAYGWWWWRRTRTTDEAASNVRYSSQRGVITALAITAFLSAIAGFCVSQLHLWWPALFPEEASFPYLDAATTVMSFTAMWLLARKRIESWYYWIVVDVIGIWLYAVKDVRFIALLYVILLIMAMNGLRIWRRQTRTAA